MQNMMMMLQDKCVSVQKMAIRVSGKLFRDTLMWLSKSKTVTGEMETAWSSVNDLKKYILKLIDSDLDGYDFFLLINNLLNLCCNVNFYFVESAHIL